MMEFCLILKTPHLFPKVFILYMKYTITQVHICINTTEISRV